MEKDNTTFYVDTHTIVGNDNLIDPGQAINMHNTHPVESIAVNASDLAQAILIGLYMILW